MSSLPAGKLHLRPAANCYGSFTQESSTFSKTLTDIFKKWWRMVILKK
jgi:hypothetical protein